MDDNEHLWYDSGNKLFLSGRSNGKQNLRGLRGWSHVSSFEASVLRALDELDDHLVMDDVHEEAIASFLEDNEDVAERPGVLVAAGAVPLHEMTQVEYKSFRAYSMGDTVVVEERGEDGWQKAVTVPYDVAVLVAQARAEQRSRALRMDHEDLRQQVNEELRRRMDSGGGGPDDNNDYFGTSSVQSLAQQQGMIQESMGAPASHTTTMSDVDVKIEGGLEDTAEEVLEQITKSRLENFSIGQFEVE